MTSSRYTTAVFVLVALALVPTVIHSYAGIVVDDGRTAKALPSELAGVSSTPTARSTTNRAWGRRRFDTDDWIERQYKDSGHEVRLTVVRSYDLKTLYHHPELAVAYHEGNTFDGEETRRFPANPDVPVHVLRAAGDSPAIAMYVLQYGDSFVDSGVAFQLRSAAELLLTGRKPMTLFFVLQEAPPATADVSTLTATKILFAALGGFASEPTAR